MMRAKKSNNINMTKAAATLSIASAMTLAVSFLKESAVAYYFGISSVADACAVAIDLPIILFSALSMAISTVLVPNYTEQLVKGGKEKAEYYACNFATIVLFSSMLVLLIGEIFSDFIVSVAAPGLNPETAYLASSLFRIVLPATLIAVLIKINTGICNSHNEFFAPALAPNFLNITVIVGLIFFSSSYGIYVVAVATVIGSGVELVYSNTLRRAYVDYEVLIDFKDDALKKSIRMAIPVFLGISAMEINKIVDKVISSLFESGSISTLNYASKLSSGISSLLITAITIVAFPTMATSVAQGNHKNVAKTFIFSLNVYIILLFPIIAGGGFLSQEIIKIVYGRGLFDINAVQNTAPVFVCYLACLLFSSFRQSSARFFYSYGDTRSPMMNAMVGVVLNIIFDIILAKIFGVQGLALATTISTAAVSFTLLFQAKKKNPFVRYDGVLQCGIKSGVASLMMLLVLWGVKKIMEDLYNLNSIWFVIPFTTCEILFGMIVYSAMLFVLKVNEVTAIKSLIINRIKLI